MPSASVTCVLGDTDPSKVDQYTVTPSTGWSLRVTLTRSSCRSCRPAIPTCVSPLFSGALAITRSAGLGAWPSSEPHPNTRTRARTQAERNPLVLGARGQHRHRARHADSPRPAVDRAMVVVDSRLHEPEAEK